jgi:N-acetyl sugar amidotransferase
MKYCVKCLYPDTKPDLVFNEQGVCSACTAFEERKRIDWHTREIQFNSLVAEMKKASFGYDCIVPVSGGKDSHYQIIKALEHGLRPLAVTATTDDLSIIGRRNLNNISKLGVDHIEVSVNPQLRKRINAYTLREVGDISWAEHVTIFTIPLREAQLRSIKYIIWGENPQNEYGGPTDLQSTMQMSTRWLQEFGGLNGLRVTDLVDRNLLNWDTSWQYSMPSTAENLQGLFLGQFFPWDGKANADLAIKHGFEVNPGPVEGCGENYENLDNYQTGIHDYFKYLKFGFGRATDIACNHIRRGYLTRSEGAEFIMEFDGHFPRTYLGKPLEDTLKRIDVSVEEFMTICDKFTNKKLFNPRGPHNPRPRLKQHILDA